MLVRIAIGAVVAALLAVLALVGCCVSAAHAQRIDIPPRRTVATLPDPSATLAGRIYAVTDALSATSCATGGGSNVLLCQDKGDEWEAVGTGMGGAVEFAEDGQATAGLAVEATDARLSNARAPTAHETTHRQGGTDPIDGTLAANITGNAATATSATSATTASTAAVAEAGDSATGFFPGGTVEAARLPALSGLSGAVTDSQVPNGITVDLAAVATLANSVADDAVALGTKTTGPYVSSATAGGGLTVAGSEGASAGITPCLVDGHLRKWTLAGGWECAADSAGGSPGGSDTQVQFNDGGNFGGDADLSWNSGGGLLTITGKTLATETISVGASASGAGEGAGLFLKAAAGAAASVYLQGTDGVGNPMIYFDPTTGPDMSLSIGDALTLSLAKVGEGAALRFVPEYPYGRIRSHDSSAAIISLESHTGAAWASTLRVTNGTTEIDAARYVQFKPLASPPVNCGDASTLGYEYTDTSLARCFCDGTAWQVLNPLTAGVGGCS
jgi:hypothetical protein